MAGAGKRPAVDALRALVGRITTPLLPDDYLKLANPLWSARELRGRVVEVRRETEDSATLVIKPGWGFTFDYQPGQFVTIGGEKLEYACFGSAPDKAPTIVMLHEGLGCIALWRDFPAKLAAATGFGVFAYSRAGYGQSDPVTLPRPLDYMTREAMTVVPPLTGPASRVTLPPAALILAQAA